MPKNKRPAPRKSATSTVDNDDELTQKLCDLALDLAEREDDEALSDELRQKQSELNKLVKRYIFQKKDDVLYEALQLAKDADISAFQLLKEQVEEVSESDVTAGPSGKNVEINAFMIPMFVSTTGGLQFEDCFEDQEAFELLSSSLQQAGLESEEAVVVLVSHAYHLDEIDAIIYSHLNEMLREARAAILDKRGAATPALDRSFGPWPETQFGPEDHAVELRFLLGFALKKTDDAFYRVPQDEAEMYAYFEARAARFEQWSEQIQPVIKRCLVMEGNPEEIEVNFLYQDLFHGAKEQAVSEYFMLQLMSELNYELDQHGVEAAKTKAIVGPVDAHGDTLLRVNLFSADDNKLIVSTDKPCSAGRDLEEEIADVQDALSTIGVTTLFLAQGFDEEGKPIAPKAF